MTLGNKNCKNSCCAWHFICKYPGKLIQMQVGNASISLGRGNWGCLHSSWLFGAVFYWCSHGFLHWKGKEVIAGRYFKWNIKCAVTLLLPNSPCFSHCLSDLPLAWEASVFWGAAGLFAWLTIFKTYLFSFFFFLCNMFTVYLAWLPLALTLQGAWPSGPVASLDIYIKNQGLFH